MVGGLDEWLERWYRRSRFRYLVGIAVLVIAGILIVILLGVYLLARSNRESATNFLIMEAGIGGTAFCGAMVACFTAIRSEHCLIQFARNGLEGIDVEELWADVSSLNLRLVRRFLLWIAVPATPALVVLAAWRLNSHSFEDVLAELIGVAGISLINVAFGFLTITVAARPVLAELSPDLPTDFEANVRLPITRLIPIELSAVALVSGTVVAALTLPVGSGDAGLLRAYVVASIVAISLTLLLNGLIAAQILGPVRSLMTGTRRVAAGDLEASVSVSSADEHGLLALSFNKMVDGLRQREALYDALGRYVDPVLASRVLSGEQHRAEAVQVTVMFVDLEAFTTFAETSDPDSVIDRLNAFFDIVIPVVEGHGGHVNKLLGDGALAVFGAPHPLESHAATALDAALEIAAAIETHAPEDLRCGIGLNSGRVVIGSMGGGRKLDFTLIGDAVNVAARTEAMTRTTGDIILMTQSTLAELPYRPPAIEDRGEIQVKGRSEPLTLYGLPRGLLGPGDPTSDGKGPARVAQ